MILEDTTVPKETVVRAHEAHEVETPRAATLLLKLQHRVQAFSRLRRDTQPTALPTDLAERDAVLSKQAGKIATVSQALDNVWAVVKDAARESGPLAARLHDYRYKGELHRVLTELDRLADAAYATILGRITEPARAPKGEIRPRQVEINTHLLQLGRIASIGLISLGLTGQSEAQATPNDIITGEGNSVHSFADQLSATRADIEVRFNQAVNEFDQAVADLEEGLGYLLAAQEAIESLNVLQARLEQAFLGFNLVPTTDTAIAQEPDNQQEPTPVPTLVALAETSGSHESLTITSSRANVRTEPDSNNSQADNILTTLSAGETVTYLGTATGETENVRGNSTWFQVRLENGQEGFIWSGAVTAPAVESPVAQIVEQEPPTSSEIFTLNEWGIGTAESPYLNEAFLNSPYDNFSYNLELITVPTTYTAEAILATTFRDPQSGREVSLQELFPDFNASSQADTLSRQVLYFLANIANSPAAVENPPTIQFIVSKNAGQIEASAIMITNSAFEFRAGDNSRTLLEGSIVLYRNNASHTFEPISTPEGVLEIRVAQMDESDRSFFREHLPRVPAESLPANGELYVIGFVRITRDGQDQLIPRIAYFGDHAEEIPVLEGETVEISPTATPTFQMGPTPVPEAPMARGTEAPVVEEPVTDGVEVAAVSVGSTRESEVNPSVDVTVDAISGPFIFQHQLERDENPGLLALEWRGTPSQAQDLYVYSLAMLFEHLAKHDHLSANGLSIFQELGLNPGAGLSDFQRVIAQRLLANQDLPGINFLRNEFSSPLIFDDILTVEHTNRLFAAAQLPTPTPFMGPATTDERGAVYGTRGWFVDEEGNPTLVMYNNFAPLLRDYEGINGMLGAFMDLAERLTGVEFTQTEKLNHLVSATDIVGFPLSSNPVNSPIHYLG